MCYLLWWMDSNYLGPGIIGIAILACGGHLCHLFLLVALYKMHNNLEKIADPQAHNGLQVGPTNMHTNC